MEEQNKKLEAIMNVFKELSYDEKKEKVISLVENLGEGEVYEKTLVILKEFGPTEEYLTKIYHSIMETNLKIYEKGLEQEKTLAQQKMQEYMNKLNELSIQQKSKDEKEAEDLLSSII